MNLWDDLVKLLKSSFERNIYPNLTQGSNLSGLVKLSMVIYGTKNTLYHIRERHFDIHKKSFNGLISHHKLNRFFTLVNEYKELLISDWSEIYESFKKIYDILYPGTSPTIIQDISSQAEFRKKRKEKFHSYILNLFKSLDSVDNFPSHRSLGIKFNCDKATIKCWIDELIKSHYTQLGFSKFNEANDYINLIREINKSKPIEYNRIKNFIEKKGGQLITTEQNFKDMSIKNTKRYIQIAHSTNKMIHQWSIRVDHLIYDNEWCPKCKIRKSEIMMALFIEAIFGFEFTKTTLRSAFGISVSEGGGMHYDGYNERVIINGKIYKIAFEYDGTQHDEFPNAFHNTMEEFIEQQERDLKKEKISLENEVIIIRLKESKDFTWKNANEKYEREILKQFYEATGLRLTYRGYIISLSNSVGFKEGPIDRFI